MAVTDETGIIQAGDMVSVDSVPNLTVPLSGGTPMGCAVGDAASFQVDLDAREPVATNLACTPSNGNGDDDDSGDSGDSGGDGGDSGGDGGDDGDSGGDGRGDSDRDGGKDKKDNDKDKGGDSGGDGGGN